MICQHCSQPIATVDLKQWRWVGWVVSGTAPVARQEDPEWSFHKTCFPLWLKERNQAMQELDRPINSNAYFVREKGMLGSYVRDGKSCSVKAEWLQMDIFGTNIFGIKDTLLERFRIFLAENNWLNEDWYKPRNKC